MSEPVKLIKLMKIITKVGVGTRGCPDFWWNFKTFIRTTIDGGAKNPVGGGV